MLLNEESPIPLKQAIILASPHLLWRNFANDKHLVQLWAVAVSEVPYTDEVCQSVVATLLQIASITSLQPSIPLDMWSWLKKCPSLPPTSTGHSFGSIPGVFQTIRRLQNIEILKSYLLLIWSEWGLLNTGGFNEMLALIREDFSGIRMLGHRRELLQHLYHVLNQVDLGLEHLQQHNPRVDEGSIWWMMSGTIALFTHFSLFFLSFRSLNHIPLS